MVNRKAKTLPFSIRRDDRRTLVQQVVDGVREAIVRGYYRPGDLLPRWEDFAPTLGVSEIVVRGAVRQLANEGFISVRPRIGSVVRDRGEKQWLGHVLFVDPEGDLGYFHTLFADELRTRLNKAGYLFTRATVEREGAEGPYEFSLLDAALSRSVDLVITLQDRPPIFRHLAKKGVSFAAVASKQPSVSGAVGQTRLDFLTAVPDFVEACVAAGVRKVVHVNWYGFPSGFAQALREAGITAVSVSVKPEESLRKLFVVEAAALTTFARHIESSRFDRDAVYFFADDYVARGALMAMAQAGLRAPDDVRVATWANAGLGPAYFRPLSRMEMDPIAAGATVAAASLEYLATGKYTEGTVIGPKWIKGETLCAADAVHRVSD